MDFFSKLRDPKSSSIFNNMIEFARKKFLDFCDNIIDAGMISIAFQDFITNTSSDFSKLWDIDYCSNRSYYIEIVEGIEGLLCKALYFKMMEIIRDDMTVDRLLEKFCFITLKQLGINEIQNEIELLPQIKSISLVNVRLLRNCSC